MKTSREIRRSFLEFFRSKGHAIVPSSPVVLPADPTLLFTNAGMNQFKDIFLGGREPTDRRVANTQKCIRVSGKHNDLEEVGRDTYHHTFFEMLGNWSFGDYYKREAIAWAWELLTGVWGLPRARLWATVYREDDEAAALWREVTDIDPSHVLRFGEKDNFWEMGDTGPCGPCSEIHFDRTPGGAGPEMVNAGSPDVIEVWNLVFIQFNRRADGRLEELPSKHVDTGMGFERITAVLQGKHSNYDTDIFAPLIGWLRERSGREYEGENAVAMRVIADHVRALAFAIADGVIPSNEGRGYVLRRLLRRAARFGRRLGFREPFLGELVPVLEGVMGDTFPELGARRDTIRRVLRAEEESFEATLDRGLELFEAAAAAARRDGGTVFPGSEAFKLYDTYGFPIDLTRLMAAERGLTVDEAGFEREMAVQRERARAARRAALEGGAGDRIAALAAAGLTSRFVGYERLEAEATVTAVLGAEGRIGALEEGQTGEVLLDVTPFYGEAGGQIGDRGRLESADGVFEVLDTQKPAEGVILHRGRVVRGRIGEGARVRAAVDERRRRATMRHHTGTHLLNAALRRLVGQEVKQAGSWVGPERLRFDFTWFEAVPPETLRQIEETVNLWILDDRPVTTVEMPLKDVAGTDIVAVFDDRYGEVVRVVSVEGVSRELCGGTHARRTGELGLFRIESEGSVASGIRRIEALCGQAAWAAAREDRERVERLSRALSANPAEVVDRVAALLAEHRELQKAMRAAAAAAVQSRAEALLAAAVEVGGAMLIHGYLGEASPDALKQAADALAVRRPDAVIALGSSNEGKAAFAVVVPEVLVARGVHAGRLAGAIAKLAGGGGGGRPERAQAGGRDGTRAAAAVAAAPEFLRQALAGG
ncbi:MAG: alanine--tRNA ligase [Kiritimatiellae bacterium]|nr:alanine--tRNA ligase [Kiritimatiellia bacterium]